MGRPLLATLALAACAGAPAAQGASFSYLCRVHDPLLGADAEQRVGAGGLPMRGGAPVGRCEARS